MPGTPNDLTIYDEVVVPDLAETPKPKPLDELGATGLKRAAGIIDEEFLPALRGRKAVQVYREMSNNDPTIGALLFTITQLLKNVDYRVEAPDNTPDATKASDFIEQCMDDMSHTWQDMISEILTCMVYGWSWMEITYKKRVGPWETDPKKKSKYDDGAFGWRKIAIRSQETMQRWMFDEEGGVAGMIQLSPPRYQSVLIPIEKSLLFRFNPTKGNPEGVSLLRNAYRPWYFKKRLEEFEAIGVERDLAGMPVASIPAKMLNAAPGTPDYKTFQSFKKLVSNIRRDEHEGIVFPMAYDQDTKQPLYKFELMSAGGSRQFDTNALIQRYEQRMLMTVLADFIMVGHEGTGSYALHVDKTGIFRSALNSLAQMIADVFNRYAIPRLFELNGWKLPELPKIVPNNVDPPDLTQLSSFMTAMGSLGMEWFPDPELEKFLRETAHLPELPDEMLELRRQMANQQAVMGYAQQQMDMLGMQQQAELVGRGYTPDQAVMAMQSPNEEMIGNQAQQQQAMDMTQQQSQAHIAQNSSDEQRAQGDHARAMEMMTAQEKRDQAVHGRGLQMQREQSKGKTRDDQLATRDTKRQMMLERLKQKGATDKAKADQAKARIASKQPPKRPAPGGKK